MDINEWFCNNYSIMFNCCINLLYYRLVANQERKKGNLLNMLTVIGVTALVLYAEWFPILNSIILLSATSVIVWAIYRIEIEGRQHPKDQKGKLYVFHDI